ncbi:MULTISPECIES: hypothetical protein [unclassified Nostoc]|uniref:hypothetical protein n=1 Tax=unclassified Nostoc TaxID=2593658 RepID=UPI002AD593F1|nr:hypothetical protein [Nostoc sp. DedQUE03]MDZ7971016.1 hypothetical protein [Nostoc sp. DedQUE03]MDZ8049440.1 hypothetical protein [Nostoc sp. DedQUE02]
MNNDPNDRDFEQQSQRANSEVRELEALRSELRELKEEIKNKQQITSGDIAQGVAGGIMKVIFTFVILYFALTFIVLLFTAFTSIPKHKLPNPSITSPASK